MILGIVILVIVWLFICAIVWSCCKVAAEADKQSEEIYKAMKKIDWQKPELIKLAKVTKGNGIACITCYGGSGNQNCVKGVMAEGECSKGVGN